MINFAGKLAATIVLAASIGSFANGATAAPATGALALKNAVPTTVESVYWRRRGYGYGYGYGGVGAGFLAGAIIGALARLIVPGKQNMSAIATIVVGIVAAIIGGILWVAIFPDNDGIAWIGSILVAVALVYLYAQFFTGRTRA